MSLSVLMSVYAKENPGNLDLALTSIWDEQSLRPEQIVLVKDGPVGKSLDIVIDKWVLKLRKVLTVLELPRNRGLAVALNEGLKLCKFELIARMDSDDVSKPDRFEKQVAYMNFNPDVAASSGAVEEWDEYLELKLYERSLPCEHRDILSFSKYRSPLSHPAAIFRLTPINSVGGYPDLRKAQDYALWSQLIVSGYKLANIPDVVVKMRTGKDLLQRRNKEYFEHEKKLMRFQRQIGFLNMFEYSRNLSIKFLLRSAPINIRSWLYKSLR